MLLNQKEANFDGGLTFCITPPRSVDTNIENCFIPSRSDNAYLKVPVISVYPSR